MMRARVIVACLASIALHVGVLVTLRSLTVLPEVGFEIELPAEIELGVSDGVSATATAPSPEASQEIADPAAEGTDVTREDVVVPKPAEPKKRKRLEAKESDAIADAGVSDAGRPDAGSDCTSDTKVTDAGPREHGDVAADAIAKGPRAADTDAARASRLSAYAPEGAQLALRLDMRNVRKSIYAEIVREVLAAIPDFRLLLDGSGVDPVDDVSRLFVASPNLQRSKLVMAGEHEGGAAAARRAVERLARARGKTATWEKRAGIAVAPWENLDTTPRVIALIGPSQFAITRSEDLPRILNIARDLAKRGGSEAHAPSGSGGDAEALLAMREGELLAFSVENAKAFVRGKTQGVPERASLSISIEDDHTVVVRTEGVHASPEDAKSAHAFWDELRVRYAKHPLVALSGMAAPLRKASLEATDDRLLVTLRLGPDHVRFLLQFVRDSLTPPPPTILDRSPTDSPATAPVSPSPSPPPTAPNAPTR